MVQLSLFQGDTAAGWTDGTNASGLELASAFTVGANGECDGLRWYRNSTTVHAPTKLRLWDVPLQAVVLEATSIPDNGAVGWQTWTAPNGVPLPAGRQFRVSALWPGPARFPQKLYDGLALPPSFMAWSSPAKWGVGTELGAYPDGFSDSLYIHSPDVVYVPWGSVTPAGPGDVSGSLPPWLSSLAGTNTHQLDGLPWLTKAGVDALAASLGSAAVLPGGTVSGGLAGLSTQLAAGILAIKGVDGATIAAVLTALANLLSVANNLKGLLDGTGGGGRLGGVADDGKTVLGVLADIQDQLDRLEQQHLRAHVIPAIPGDNWEFLANTEVTPNIAWPQEADAYLLNISAFPPRAFGGDKSAGTYLPRVGWWCPLNVDFAVGQEPIRFAKQMLWLPGVRMNGVAVELLTGCVGVIEAWRYAGW